MNTTDLTYNIINAAYEVHNILGTGFNERVYCVSLYHELTLRNYVAELEKPIKVYYKKKNVGLYKADIFVENCIIIETKCVDTIINAHIKQAVPACFFRKKKQTRVKNYLASTGLMDALIINFKKQSVIVKHVYP